MADPFVAEIRIFPFNFAPPGWAFCNGQLLPISQNTALFSLLGTTYGGNGQSNFALPDLQGRAAIASGQGPGLSLYDLGESGGAMATTLAATEIPSHDHDVRASTSAGTAGDPTNRVWAGAAVLRQGTNLYAATGGAAMSPNALSTAGGGQPHNNMPPYVTLNFCIAMQGVFPPRT